MAGDETPPQAPPPADEPEWARSLRESIEQLPGKLRATVTDDDKRGIAEHVHQFFDQSGAFERGEPAPPEEEEEAEPGGPAGPPEKPPDQEPTRKSLAHRVFGTGV